MWREVNKREAGSSYLVCWMRDLLSSGERLGKEKLFPDSIVCLGSWPGKKVEMSICQLSGWCQASTPSCCMYRMPRKYLSNLLPLVSFVPHFCQQKGKNEEERKTLHVEDIRGILTPICMHYPNWSNSKYRWGHNQSDLEKIEQSHGNGCDIIVIPAWREERNCTDISQESAGAGELKQ